MENSLPDPEPTERILDEFEEIYALPETLRHRIDRWVQEDLQREPVDHEKVAHKVAVDRREPGGSDTALPYRTGYRHGKLDHQAGRKRRGRVTSAS